MSFQDAIRDYRYLKNRRYPDKAALKLVSDHHRLGALQRNCLFRAVFAGRDCRRRRHKLVEPAEVHGSRLGVDWYNVLITVESYLKGYPVFLADDGLVRDSSAVHGSYRASKVTEQAIQRILDTVAALGPGRVELFLDAPISFSGEMAETLRLRGGQSLPESPEVSVSPSADYPLKSFPGIVASSDSSIVDRESVRAVFDLPRCVLQRVYGAELPTAAQLGDRLAAGS
jgi:hypothetical protein